MKYPLIRLFTAFLFLFFFSKDSISGTGWCEADNGVYQFNANIGNINVTDPNHNVPGNVFYDVVEWNLGDTYSGRCDCTIDEFGFPTYFTTKTNLVLGHNDGVQYYSVNDYLEVSSKVFIGAGVNDFIQTPITNFSNNAENKKACGKINNYSAGGQGKLSFYIKKSFVGQVFIPATEIFSLFASANPNSIGPTPLTRVIISGSITVPQRCSINAGTLINVDFGAINSSDFTNKGQIPNGYTPKTFNVPIQCNDVSATAGLSIRIQAVPSQTLNSSIASSNPTIGVMVTDIENRPLLPNNDKSVLPFTLDSNLGANITLKTYPVSTVDEHPTAGAFFAIAFLRIDFF